MVFLLEASYEYTFCVYYIVSDLVWDKGNRRHATRHGVSIREIEEVFRRDPYIEPYQSEEDDDEEQFRAYGTTAKGRYVTVPFTIREGGVRPITSWPMTPKELEDYADQLHQNDDEKTETEG